MNELPKRKQIRLKNYDYSQNGFYFITICTHNKQKIFWNENCFDFPVGADIIRPLLSDYGKIAGKAINEIPIHYPNIKIEQYIIMPDHIHMILEISNAEHNGRIISAPTALSRRIGQMKRFVSKEIGFPIWQKSYYEHIIRNERDYTETLEYSVNNPLKYKILHE